MSQQLTLDKFFMKTTNTKIQCHEESMSNLSHKKRNLSLSRVSPTPSKCTKSTSSHCAGTVVQEVVDLCDDDSSDDGNASIKQENSGTTHIKEELISEPENATKLEFFTSSKSCAGKKDSDTSDSTIEYFLTPEVQNKTADKIIIKEETNIKVRHNYTENACDIKPSTSALNISDIISETFTPKKENVLLESSVTLHKVSLSSPQTPQTSKSNGSPAVICVRTSPHNSHKLVYYSPSKKRNLMKKNGNVCKNLNIELSSLQNCDESFHLNETFKQACTEMEDKTIFMLSIIYRYLKEKSLHHLLGSVSHSLLCNCLEVIKPGMTIVCRLYWRKCGWYKIGELLKIAMETASDEQIKNVMKSLMDAGLIVEGDTTCMTFEDYIEILKREEILQICKDLNIKTASKQKYEAVQELLKFSKRKSNISNYFKGKESNNLLRLLNIMCEKTGLCYMLSDQARATFNRLYVMMFLGTNYDLIREKRLELTLLYEKVGRETYPVDKALELDNASVVFSKRDEFESYFTACGVYEDYIQRTDTVEKCNIIKQVFKLYKEISKEQMSRYASLPTWLRRYTPADIYIKLLELGVKELKKEKREEHNSLAILVLDALIEQDNFRQHKKAEWYSEKALILHNNKLYNEAATVLLEGFNSKMSEEAKDTLRPRALKIANKSDDQLKDDLIKHATTDRIHESNIGGEHIHKPPMERFKNRGKLKFETKIVEGRLVQEAEEYCIAHYISNKNFTNGEHWEGRIVTTIFYIIFWDIIYSKPAGVTGVFLSHYQLFPLDLFTDSFYTNRKVAIDNHLTFIENATIHKLLNIMQDTWNLRPESELSGINRSIGWQNVSMVCMCLGPRRLSAICRRLAENYRYTHSGFPDLTLWNRDTYHVKFVEVKTDSDKPSMKQIQWMNFLKEIGIETEFCYVGVNTTRQKCRQNNKKITRRKKVTAVNKIESNNYVSESSQVSQVRLIQNTSSRETSPIRESDNDFQMSSIVQVHIKNEK